MVQCKYLRHLELLPVGSYIIIYIIFSSVATQYLRSNLPELVRSYSGKSILVFILLFHLLATVCVLPILYVYCLYCTCIAYTVRVLPLLYVYCLYYMCIALQ